MKKIKILISTLILASIISCKDEFLNVQPLGVLSEANLSNKVGVDLVLTGAYSLMDGVQTNVNSAFGDWQGAADNWVYGSVASDDAYKGSNAGDQPEISVIEAYNHTPDLVHFRGKWRAVYDGVARTNDVILLSAKATDMTDAEKQLVIAQARTLRGHFHFEARKMFGKVPYIDDKTYNPSDANSTKVSNTDEIWPKIEEDLKFGYANLPSRWAGVPGRTTKWAAAALLAKAMLFQGKYSEAKPILEDIVNNGGFRLMPKYGENYRTSTNNNAESIFEVQFSVNDGAAISNNGNRGGTLNYPYGGGALTTCCGFFQPSQSLANAFKTTADGLPITDPATADLPMDNSQAFTGPIDPRIDHTLGRDGVPYLDWGIHNPLYIRDRAYAGGFSPKKSSPLRSENGSLTWSNNPRQNANNYRMIKLSHVILWLAECEVEVGSLERARTLVNQIRNRAANPEGFVTMPNGTPAGNYVIKPYTSAWTDKTVAREAVRTEIRLEFGMEGHRFFDLVRWGIADQVLNRYLEIESNKRTYLKGSRFIKGKHEYFPIPNQEILNSSKNGQPTLKQNQGY
ncbi:MAG: RagB/SusD family nutrient uptake outer membrane protein [Emticicia sp.]|uniref:RagB/SusD family nutrient uptake outer membrane protein n=1 Tax=Emticicia sp. TaxID=1930953 RepID=UPI003BA401EA